jgi:acyl carrier protein
MDDEIRRVLGDHGRLPLDAAGIGDHDDLFELGLSSHASVNVMMALEDAFGIEFPEAMLRKSTFESVAAIRGALAQLVPEHAGATRVAAAPSPFSGGSTGPRGTRDFP